MTQPTTPTPPTPPTPPVSPPEPTPEVKLDTTPQNYYQAIGWLRGKLVQVEDRFQIQVNESLLNVFYLSQQWVHCPKNILNLRKKTKHATE